MAVEISFWNLCNNNCEMCTNPDDFKGGRLISLTSIKKYLNRDDIRKKKNVREVYLSGGEPTMQPDFFKIISFLQDKYPIAQIKILTNGRRFFYEEFSKACVNLGKVNFIIPIHGFDEITHDEITRVEGSFHQTVAGLKNIMHARRIGQEVEIRIIITKLNYKKIKRILDFVHKEIPQADRLVIIFLEYEGQAIKNFKNVKLSYADFMKEFKIIKPFLGRDKEIRFYHFPLCVVPYDFWPYLWRTLRADEVTFLNQCEKCKMKEFCLGIHKNYLKLFGRKEFQPIRESFLIESDNNYHHPIASVKKQ
jgi:His-Xaa-Ser system radical SAM maturase HxsC